MNEQIASEIKVITMPDAVCLDTRVLSRFLSRKEPAIALVERFQEESIEIYTTCVNVSEFFMGLWKVGPISSKRLKDLQGFFADIQPRALDYPAASLAGKLYGEVLRGKEIGWRDTFIAAIVLLNGKKIVTSNPDHFRRIPDIEVTEFMK